MFFDVILNGARSERNQESNKVSYNGCEPGDSSVTNIPDVELIRGYDFIFFLTRRRVRSPDDVVCIARAKVLKVLLLGTQKKPAAPCADVSLNPQKQVGAASFHHDEIIIRKAK